LKPVVVRVALYGLVALALAGALRFTPQLPDPDAKAADVLVQQQGAPAWQLRSDTLHRGESLGALFGKLGLPDSDVTGAVAAITSSIDARKIPADLKATVVSAPGDSAPSEITLQLPGDNRLLRLSRSGNAWTATPDTLATTTDTIVVRGAIARNSNLYRAVDVGAGDGLPKTARTELTSSLADVYEYRVDMSRDLQAGDAFTVAAERSVDESGGVHIKRVIAATFSLSGKIIDAIKFTSGSGVDEYFDQFGKSMRTAFLKAPLSFKYISSGFGMRLHPILGIMREHKGTDYAAAAGTPVEAVGDGVVTRAGWAGGYGNLVEIRHANGIVTRYGHMRAFANGIHAGVRVSQKEVIGYVGATGLATGPHLHFEVLVDGQQRPPSKALNAAPTEPVPDSESATFAQLRDRLIASLQAPTTGVAKLALQ
jgi:murein DD-endopeptidase MepM/ murein hydrolase activator NlpD